MRLTSYVDIAGFSMAPRMQCGHVQSAVQVCSVQCEVCSVQCVVCSVQCAVQVCSEQHTVCFVRCAV